jgi:hypothetical protein
MIELIKSLIEAQGEFPPILKDTTNPYFSNKYANLDTVCSTVNPILRKHGLIVVQTAENDGLRTTLYHISGQSITGCQKLFPSKNDPQGWHGAQTYARRYGLLGILGLAAEDDDGNSGSKKPENKPEDIQFGDPIDDPITKRNRAFGKMQCGDGEFKGKRLEDLSVDEIRKHRDSIPAEGTLKQHRDAVSEYGKWRKEGGK